MVSLPGLHTQRRLKNQQVRKAAFGKAERALFRVCLLQSSRWAHEIQSNVDLAVFCGSFSS